LLWLIAGPFFAFSDTWQLFANTATTIITFWMVFVIQAAQNRDGAAIQAKLDELIRASNARNEFIGIDRTSAGGRSKGCGMSEPDHGPRTIVQATGRVAESIVGSMQTQPLLLALVLVNILFMGFCGGR
jgi:low affinity Fe/Cu permease